MNRSGVNRKTLIGVETTAGTAVAANRYTPTLSWMLNRERDTKTFKAQGSKTPSAHVLHKQLAKGSVEGVLDYNSCMYLFDSLGNAATPSQIGSLTAYQRVWTFSGTVADTTGKTFTVEDGDDTACEDYAYTKVASLDIEAGEDDFTIKGGLLSRYPTDNQTLASSPTEVPQRPVERNDINLYADDTYGALGTTQITEALSESLSLSEKFKEIFVHNRSASEFHDIIEIPYDPKFKFSSIHNSVLRTQINALSSNPYKYFRWEAIGASLGTSGVEYFETIRFDMCAKFDNPERLGDEDSPLGYNYDCTLMPDTSLGGFLKVTVINSRATL